MLELIGCIPELGGFSAANLEAVGSDDTAGSYYVAFSVLVAL